jgi:hypothetical protein
MARRQKWLMREAKRTRMRTKITFEQAENRLV